MSFDIDRKEFDEAVRRKDWEFLWSAYEALRQELGRSPTEPKEQVWVIDVHSWGRLIATGTEAEAETWRRHKANWEHSGATKRLATQEEIDAAEAIDDLSELLG